MKRTYKECKACGKSISASNYEKHLKNCQKPHEEKSYKCEICNKECNKHSLAYHRWSMHTKEGEVWKHRKKENQSPDVGIKISSSLKEGYGSGRLKPSIKSEEGRKRLSEASRSRVWSKESRKKLSESIQKRYDAGWMPKAGRCKKLEYRSPSIGLVKLDGTWELAVAQYLDQQQLEWIRNTKKFSYIDNQGKERRYTPDFYVKSWDSYLEVKGYETDLDRAKWKCFPEKLIVWKKKELKEKGMLR